MDGYKTGMRYSKTLIPTVKEVPAEAEIPSHRLMIRAGYIRKLASGTYTYLPLGWRSLRKIMQIVREEMDAAGALEISMPILQPIELWQRTGREAAYGPTMCKFEDRHGRINALAPTAEEVVTAVAAQELKSYKQLPVNLYQINTKFRDEFRPRFGVLRSREFLMKDAYSFHADPQSLETEYRRMYDAYCRIFKRCGIPYVAVEAETGEMGGSGSHQFTVPCETGEDVIVYTADGSYAANIEKAAVDPLPRATPPADAPAPEPVHTPGVGSIEAVCAFLKTSPTEMIKTLIYSTTDGKVVACLLRGDHELNPEKLVQALGSGAELAAADVIERVSGASVGFAGPLGLSERVDRVLIDHAVAALPIAVTGANRTDYHTRNVVPGRDFALEGPSVTVTDIRNAVEGDTYGGQTLLFKRGIEVGQVFKLGTKYSKALDAAVLDEQGQPVTLLMGCYGIGINRILASAIEVGNDKDGCVLPPAIAPYEIEVIPLGDTGDVPATAERIYEALRARGADVLLDDRDARPGVKFKDADLIGIPLRVVVGEKSLKDGKVEVKRRTDAQPTLLPLDEAVEQVMAILAEMKTA